MRALRLALIIVSALLMACVLMGIADLARANEWGSPIEADTVVIVTIDGIRSDNADSMLAEMHDSLMTWGAAHFANFETARDGLTDPRHRALVTGYHETLDSCCCNLGAPGTYPHTTIGTLLNGGALFVTAKEHLSGTIPDCGTTVLVDLGFTEGPDSVSYRVWQDSMATIRPAFSLLELARYDKRAHVWTTSGYWSALDSIGREAGRIVIDLANSLRNRNVLLVITTDHGRHEDEWPGIRPFVNHGHTPCGAALCDGCNDIFAYIIGPGVIPGTYTRAYSHENLAATAMLLFGLPIKSQAVPITDCFAVFAE